MKKSLLKIVIVVGIIGLLLGMSSITGVGGGICNQSKVEAHINSSLGNELLAYWKFDDCENGTAYDSSGNGYHGTIYGATCGGGFMVFDGVDDYVDLDVHSENLGFNKTDNYKIQVIGIKSESTDNGVIYGMSHSNGISVLVELELNSEGSFVFRVGTEECILAVSSSSGHNDGTWHFVEAIYTGSKTDPTLELYVDSELDGSITEWQYSFESSDFQTAKIGRKSNDSTNYYGGVIDDILVFKSTDGGGNTKPNAPTISGVKEGKVGVEYEYTFNATDPDDDFIMYLVDWGDNLSEWTGFCESGVEITLKHAWNDNGDFTIKAMVMDDFHAESNWSDPFIVDIESLIEIQSVNGGVFGVSAVIKNNDEESNNTIQWNITLDGSVFMGKKTSGKVDIPIGGEVTIKSRLIIGFGSIKITVIVGIPEFSDIVERNGFIWLFFVRIKPLGLIIS